MKLPYIFMSAKVEPQSRRGYVDTATGQVHYRERGSGLPVLLLHQTPASSSMWERLMHVFPDGYRLIALDTPGFGCSDPPPAPPTDGVAWYAARVVEAMDALGLEEASVVGHHTGAMIATEVAASYPVRVDKLVLIGVLAFRTHLQRHWWLSQVKRWEPDSTGAFLESSALPFARAVVTRDDPQQFLDCLVAYLQAGPNYWWAYDAVFSYDSLSRACAIQAPTLLLVGEAEFPDMVEMTADLAGVIRRSVFRTIADGTTEMAVEQPDVLADVIAAFLRNPDV
jgi:pimeloyl-ACP methyl ester carboxylesterase